VGYRHLVEVESSRAFRVADVRELGQKDPALAARAALSLGRTKDPGVQAALIDRLHRPADPAVRAMLIYGLGLLADRAPIDLAAVQAGLRDEHSVVRAAALDAAGRAIAAHNPGAPRLAPDVEARMRGDRDPVVRARAAVALAAFADTPQAPEVGAGVLRAFASERDHAVRVHEAWTLGRAFAATPNAKDIAAGLADADELVRAEFLVVLARHKDAQLGGLANPLLSDPAWRVAEQAREALRELAGGSHLAEIPAGVVTPVPVPDEVTAPLARPTDLGPPRKPVPADARLDLPLVPRTAAALGGPMPGPHPRVRIGTTKGAIVVRLYPEWAPLTVANFLNLTNRGYYDGLRWFRIVPNFVAQTGDPKNTGDGDAGYTIPAEENPLEQRAGVISMGLNYEKGAAVRDSAGTQFYLTMSPQFHLNRAFTVFGEIESGFPVLGRLVESDTMTKVEQLPDD
jgi:peptidyl-prolyl cis-trans isomerase B (cyclophilin B)